MSELVFLRPYWLLALLPAAYLWWRVKGYQTQQTAWKKWIDPAFQPYLLGEQTEKTGGSNWAMLGLGLIWFSAILALSGPSWNSVEIPAQKTHSGSVIVLDLSLSMYADDLEPNRLTRVQFKLTDLLKQNPDLRTGLVAYSATAHIITPISDDNATLLNLLPHLNPLIMPSYGSDAVAGFRLANELLTSAQVNQGHIIWITDDLEAHQTEPLKNLLEQNNLSLSILAVGRQSGGAVKIPEYGLLKDPQDRLVQAPLPLAQLQQFSQQVGARLERLQLDNRDLASLKPAYLAETVREQDDAKQMFQALDYGVYLLGLLIVLVALSARRGWVLSIVFIAFIPGLVVSPASFAESEITQKPEIKLSDRWREVYLSGDQRGYQAWLNQNYIAAEREFDDPAWQGSALYRQQKYAQAAEVFKKDPSPQGHYNLGNALAKSLQLEEAKQAYQQALDLDPNLTQAQHNLAIVEELLKQQAKPTQPQDDAAKQAPEPGEDQNAQSETQPDQKNNESDELNDESDQTQSNQAESQTSQQNAEASTEDSEASTDQALDDSSQAATPEPSQPEPDPSASEQGSVQDLVDSEHNESPQNASQREREQANQAWLNQIRDEPGLFLRRKFDYQYQQNPPEDPQQNERKIW
ncbi:MAG: VWA domain-containing protein [Thiomicrospira sp.]|uniref:VWA domain-containing protein n=1 Tax=Thiomicrospira sp. TaxID=935 RepID=UPI0019D8DB19|nr:VWA domain-containing protein [Thiomicrospira sp.]MBE0494530.1 VWA domain-containing protein [Thiomicrospira sp.]